jgi:hypothetical protein
VAPDDGPAERFVGGFEEVGAADFFVFFGRKPGNDEIARFAEQKIAVGVFRDERGAVRFAALAPGGGLEGLPQPLAASEIHGPQVADFAIVAVNNSTVDQRRAAGAIHGRVGLAFPNDFGPGLFAAELEQGGAFADAR